MPTPEFQALQAALGQTNTPQARRQAGEALAAYLQRHPDSVSRVITSMGMNYPAQIQLTVLPAMLENNPAYFDRLKEFITRWQG